jgi:hypothetical protein
VLSAWTALEVLAPASFRKPEDLAGGDRSRIAALGDRELPWERGEKSRPGFQLYYQIVLGTMKMHPAIDGLLRRFGDSRPDRPDSRGSVALATVVIDRQGRLVESSAVAVSSFAWGVVRALRGDLADLAAWPQLEPLLTQDLERRLLGMPQGEAAESKARENPLSREAISNAHAFLVAQLGIPAAWADQPEFAIRCYTYFKDTSPPDPILLNSFFLDDIVLARDLLARNKLPKNVRRYLGMQPPDGRRDLLQNTAALAAAIRPLNTPVARWPGRDRNPLVLLQQAAVNLAFEETADGGLLGINGPPGTGKTTLLRDIAAGVISARAEAMCQFDDPQTAFSNSGQRIRVGEGGWLHLYRVDPSLVGFEMIVASSNNKAVENISGELPGLDAIAADATGLRYFKTLSDALHEAPTWGAVAAVLGNAQNRSWFKQTFWWNDDTGLNNYLRAASGFAVTMEEDEGAESSPPRVPQIILEENPPASHEEALRRWNVARRTFQAALVESRKHQAWLESLRIDLDSRGRLMAAECAARSNHATAQAAADQREQERNEASACHAAAVQVHGDAQAALRSLSATRPGFWARLFQTSAARRWSASMMALSERETRSRASLARASDHLQAAESHLQAATQSVTATHTAFQAAVAALSHAEARLLNARERHGVVLADTPFFGQAREVLHVANPWFSAAAHRARDQVFIAAMALHRAFVDAAAKPLRHNLGALMRAFSTGSLPGAEKQALVRDLWISLFLVVPLVSTTFASMKRMFGALPMEGLGWLLVDEAGQASPQAAIGGLLRTRRAVIVGDPIQIQPVVTLPDALVQAICKRFGVDPDLYAAPAASVQSLGDAASRVATEFPTRSGTRTVGAPLLVHRRCSDPMFRVSNAIAYAGLMVPGKAPSASPIRDVLGPSAWIHVSGTSHDKWCHEEGEHVLRLLDRLKQARVNPSLYVVSPFVVVKDSLRDAIQASGILEGWIEEDNREWLNRHVGTVHTVQGREAEGVIFVLGAPAAGQAGARQWAGWPPNLLNVAVTRAREALYVVGNREYWRVAGCFSQLDQIMP